MLDAQARLSHLRKVRVPWPLYPATQALVEVLVMPCGPQLIEAVASQLGTGGGMFPYDIQEGLRIHLDMHLTQRSIRYAITELIKQGRAKREGRQGAVYAVKDAAE